MLAYKPFRSLNISSMFTKRFKSTTLTRKKGEIIKQLNKENKSLFGELLETKSQKRKREKKTSLNNDTTGNFNSNSVTNDRASEIHWYSTTQSSVYLISSNKYPIPTTVVDKSNLTAEKIPEVDHQNTSEFKIDKYTDCCDSTLNIISGTETSTVTNEMAAPESQLNATEKETRKGNILELPDIIVRNIPSFPLQNRNNNRKHLELKKDSINPILSLPAFNIENKKSDYTLYPSVSKILNATMSDSSRAALKRWRQKMISDLGEEGFLAYYRGLLDKGSQFHSVVQSFLSGVSEPELKLGQVEGCWESLRSVITDVSDVRVLESHVVHSELLYRGVIDCVASYKGKPVLIEWKKSDKQKNEIEKTYDAPVQLSAYFGAMNYDPNYNIQIYGGLVVVAYSDGAPANTFSMTVTDCQKYWKTWLYRLHKYWLLQRQEEKSELQF